MERFAPAFGGYTEEKVSAAAEGRLWVQGVGL